MVIYDLDRFVLAPLRLPNFWKEKTPKAKLQPVVALALHPRDVGKLLIGYSEGAVIYTFKQNKATNFFYYELPPGAPGGGSLPDSPNSFRHPKLTHAAWHPTGTFVLTGHEDSSMVIWDSRDGRIILARNLQDINVNKPGPATSSSGSYSRPFVNIAWCAKQNPEDTGILVAGGASADFPSNGLTFLELGLTPNYATSSWQILGDHFANPKRQHILPTPPNVDVVDFCLIPSSSPHYAGCHDPIAFLTLLASGELLTLSFPNGHPISPTYNLHVSLSYVHPFVSRMSLTNVEPSRWLAMKEPRHQNPPLLRGGAEASRPRKRYEGRTVIQTVHEDNTIRLWDPGHGDEIDNKNITSVDLGMALDRFQTINTTKVSLAGGAREMAVGTRDGEVAVFRWGRNERHAARPSRRPATSAGVISITDRVESSVTEGLLPLTLYRAQNEAVTALKLSDIGFFAAGFETGRLVIADLRVSELASVGRDFPS